MSCAGFKLSGSNRGEQCGAKGHYALRGKMYCAAHRTIAAAAPEEFTAARDTLYRRLGRAEAKRLAEAAQIDAFLPEDGIESAVSVHAALSESQEKHLDSKPEVI